MALAYMTVGHFLFGDQALARKFALVCIGKRAIKSLKHK